jgi:hypothetical protein
VPKNRPRSEYVSLIFLKAANEHIASTDLQGFRFQALMTDFFKSERGGTFSVPKKTGDGRIVQVGVGLPEWLALELKGAAR